MLMSICLAPKSPKGDFAYYFIWFVVKDIAFHWNAENIKMN